MVSHFLIYRTADTKYWYKYLGDTPVSFFAVVQCWDFHTSFVHSPCRDLTLLHCFHANSVVKWQPADTFPMLPCRRAQCVQDWTILPRSFTGIWLYDHSVNPKQYDNITEDHGDKSLCSLHAVPLDSRRGKDKGVPIKILQNLHKGKRQIIHIWKLCKGLHFAVIICTNSAGERMRKDIIQVLKSDLGMACFSYFYTQAFG